MPYFLSSRIKNNFNAFSKARNDAEQIFSEKQIILVNKSVLISAEKRKPITYYFNRFFNEYITSRKIKNLKNELIFVQYPIECKIGSLDKKLKDMFKKNKVCLLIHDINRIRYNEENDDEDFYFQHASVLISHNESMTKYLVGLGIKKEKIINLGAFDYLISQPNIAPRTKNDGVAFGGNLSKSRFVDDWDENKTSQKLVLYGANYQPNKENSGVIYKGVLDPDELVGKIEGGFGLVWDGGSVEGCDDIFGRYLLYNNPHKMSMYIVSGLPIITWESAAIADFVTKNNIGFVVKSLNDIKEKIEKISDDDYKQMRQNVLTLADQLAKGESLGKIVDTLINEQ